jgi:hypothetical protein
MTNRQGSFENIVLDATRLAHLLFPIAVLLHTSGVSRSDAETAFRRATKRAVRLTGPRAAEQIGHSIVHQEVVHRWRRDKRFLSRAGLPNDLAMQGRSGFAALVRSVDRGASARAILQVLCRYGNVKRVTRGKYRLMRPFFTVTSPKAVALEPMVRFLADMTGNLERIVRHPNEKPHVFWRMVENASLSTRAAKEFISFVEERSLTFLEELDDWLAARATNKHHHGSLRRVGLGLYTIYSDPVVNSARARSEDSALS